MYNRIYRFVTSSAIAVLLVLLFGCSKSDDVAPENTRTVMVYMAANNNLASDAVDNLNQMEEAYRDIDGKLLVYARIFGSKPTLYEIVHDEGPEIKSKVLKTYSEHNSSDPRIMHAVFLDMKNLAPSKSYGAILWSHATNWYPAEKYKPQTRSFGDDNFSSMDVQKLKDALPTDLDFLIFDACSMASVEVLYELKDVAPYILASPTEVLAVGMPYHQVATHLFASDVRKGLIEVAKAYYAYYQAKSGLEQSATFSLIDTQKLPAVAHATSNLLKKQQDEIAGVKRAGVQRMDLDPTTLVIAFDMWDMFEKNFTKSAQLDTLRKSIDEAVVFKKSTEKFLGRPLREFSGLSSYLPVEHEAEVAAFYKSLSWAKVSGYDKLFYWEDR